jgi:hypothetical protein
MRHRTDAGRKPRAIKDETLEDIRNSESFMHELSVIRKRNTVVINNKEMELDKIDDKELIKEQARDLKEI